MHLEILSRLLLLVLSWRKTLCFASSSLPAIPRVPIENDDGNNSKKFEHQPTTPIRIASLNKYGGNIKFFDLDAGENANTDTNNTVTRFSRIKNPCIFVLRINCGSLNFLPFLILTLNQLWLHLSINTKNAD